MSRDDESDPLGGFKIVDFSSVMAGPVCTRLMADVGARVIKIETSEGDQMRQRPPIRDGASSYFGHLNCGKESVVLNLKHPEGIQIAKALIRDADVVVENFRPGVMKRFGLGYDQLSSENPRMVYCSISGFGQSGPFALHAAYAPVLHAASGYELATQYYQDGLSKPLNCAIFIADVLAGVYAFGAIQTALLHRQRTGRGQYVDVSMVEAMLNMMVYEVQEAQFPAAKRRFLFTPCRATDGFIMVAPTSQRNFRQFAEAIGQPALVNDPRFSKQRLREQNWAVLMEYLEQWSMTRTAKECEDHFNRYEVPCSRYNSVKDWLENPQSNYRNTFATINDSAGSFQVTNPPFKLSGGRAMARNKVASLGGDTETVLLRELGLDAQRVDALRRAGVVG